MYNYCERKDMLSLLGRDSGSFSFSLARIIHNAENTMDSSRLLVRHAMHMYDVRPNNTHVSAVSIELQRDAKMIVRVSVPRKKRPLLDYRVVVRSTEYSIRLSLHFNSPIQPALTLYLHPGSHPFNFLMQGTVISKSITCQFTRDEKEALDRTGY